MYYFQEDIVVKNYEAFLGFHIIQGPPGKRGAKGERGETAGFIIRNGQYTLVKVCVIHSSVVA